MFHRDNFEISFEYLRLDDSSSTSDKALTNISNGKQRHSINPIAIIYL